MDYIKYKGKPLPIRYDHTAIKMIMAQFELTDFQQIDSLKIHTNIFAQSDFLKIGLIRGSKFTGDSKEWTDEEVQDVLDTVPGIIEDFLKIFKKDLQSVFTVVDDETVKKVSEAKKKNA